MDTIREDARRKVFQLQNMAPVQSEDEIVAFEILLDNLARALAGNVDAMQGSDPDRANIGQIALMPSARSGGIGNVAFRFTALPDQMQENPLRQR